MPLFRKEIEGAIKILFLQLMPGQLGTQLNTSILSFSTSNGGAKRDEAKRGDAMARWQEG